LPLFPERRAIRIASAADIPALDALYTNFAQNRTLHCPRDEKRWRYLLAMVKQTAVYANANGEAEGYLFYEHRKQGARGEETTLRILEMHCATAEARRGLTGFLAMQNVNAIDFEGSWEVLGRSGLMAAEAETEGISAQIEVATGAMIRVINFVQLAQALSVHWEGFAGEIYLAVSDGWMEGGVSAVRVAGRGGLPTVEEVEAERVMASPHRLIADVRRWSQVMVGYLSGDDACARGWLQASTPEAALCAGELFPARKPFLPPPDHF
jgi:predicted acetyltransferase